MSTPLTPIKNDLPTVLLFGRANVGKSTLFNKLIGRSQALVADVAGTTRDPNRAIAEWQGVQFNLIDAGGIVDENVLAGKAKRKTRQRDADDIDTQIQTLAREAIKTADVIVFVADTKTGLQQQDTTMARFVRRLVAPQQAIIAAANKADTAATRAQAAEFFALGFGEPSAVSAASGSGTGDLLDRIVAALPSQSAHPNAESPEEPRPIRVVVLGKPNVGKSSLLNALTGKKTAIVSAVAHTTREPQDVTMQWGMHTITFTDTAGLVRAQSSAYDDELVRGGMSKTVAALKRADIALLLLDITQAASHFEAKLASDIIESGINAIIVGNKWDLVEHKDAKAHTGIIYRHLPFLTWAPILFLSAKNRTKLKPLLETIVASHRARTAQLDPAALGEFLTSAVRHAAPLSDRKQRGIMKHKLPRPHLKELEQVATDPPRFVLHAKAKMGIKGHYITYLENRLRDKFKLVGTPVQVTVEEE